MHLVAVAPKGVPRGLRPIERAVARLYIAVFGRLPDRGGLNYWTEVIESGRLGLPGTAGWFVRSSEFHTTYGGLSRPELLRLIYLNVLGRDPDPGGLRYWSMRLADGMAMGHLVVGFSESPEFISRTTP